MRGLLLALFITGTATAGGVYKWTDAQGHVHFGDSPPSTRAERVQTDEATQSDGPRSGLRPGERAMLNRAQQAERERLRARGASARASDSERSHRNNWKEYCFRLKLTLQEYKDERRQGCHPSRCADIDRNIEYYESMKREDCQ